MAALADVFRELGEGADRYGVIHADVHLANVLLGPEGEALIDFGDCSPGHYLFDLAVTEAEFADMTGGGAYVAAFRAAYRETMTLSPADERRLEVMAPAVRIVFLGWIFTSRNPNVRREKVPWVPRIVDRLAAVGAG